MSEKTLETQKLKTEITLKTLLEVGAHFGSPKSEWNPKMSPFIHGSKKMYTGGRNSNHVYIIDLDTTLKLWHNIIKPLIISETQKGKTILFVGTKTIGAKDLTIREALKNTIAEHASACGSPFINQRWRGGLLTNFKVSTKSVETLEKYEQILESHANGTSKVYTKQELNKLTKQTEKLRKDFGGIRNMRTLPDYLFLTNADHDFLAVEEAKKLGIPVIALVDTSVDPSNITYPLPANDDSVRTLTLFIKAVSEAIMEGKELKVEITL